MSSGKELNLLHELHGREAPSSQEFARQGKAPLFLVTDRQGAPERDEEALANDAAPSGDQEAVHEAGADEWLKAQPPMEPRSDLQRE
jgi:hypothetical protein